MHASATVQRHADQPLKLDRRRRIAVVGTDDSSGKTELIQALHSMENYDASQSACEKEITVPMKVNSHNYEIAFVSTSLRGGFSHKIVFDAESMIGTDAIIFIYSCNDRASRKYIEEAHQCMLEQLSPTPFMLIATSVDPEAISKDRKMYQSPFGKVGGGGLLEEFREPKSLRRAISLSRDVVTAEEGAATAREWKCEFVQLELMPQNADEVRGVLTNLISYTDEMLHGCLIPAWNFATPSTIEKPPADVAPPSRTPDDSPEHEAVSTKSSVEREGSHVNSTASSGSNPSSPPRNIKNPRGCHVS